MGSILLIIIGFLVLSGFLVLVYNAVTNILVAREDTYRFRKHVENDE
jgi:hypothetical protein